MFAHAKSVAASSQSEKPRATWRSPFAHLGRTATTPRAAFKPTTPTADEAADERKERARERAAEHAAIMAAIEASRPERHALTVEEAVGHSVNVDVDDLSSTDVARAIVRAAAKMRGEDTYTFIPSTPRPPTPAPMTARGILAAAAKARGEELPADLKLSLPPQPQPMTAEAIIKADRRRRGLA